MGVSQIKNKYVPHLQKLVAHWENLVNKPIENIKYYELYARSENILRQICPDEQDFIKMVTVPSRENMERIIGKLRAVHLDLNDGMLFLENKLQGQLAVDLMQQAESLLNERGSDDHSHSYIPAAVLTGAVLEHFLRTLCARQVPPIPLKLENGNYKMLATLVDDLEKANVYNAVEKQQLKVWVKIRNDAAHAQLDEFTPQQVIEMIKDVKEFIETHQ